MDNNGQQWTTMDNNGQWLQYNITDCLCCRCQMNEAQVFLEKLVAPQRDRGREGIEKLSNNNRIYLKFIYKVMRPEIWYIVSVLHQDEGGIGKSIPDARSPRPERFPNFRGSREIWRAEGMDFPIPPEFWWSTDILSSLIFLQAQGVD